MIYESLIQEPLIMFVTLCKGSNTTAPTVKDKEA